MKYILSALIAIGLSYDAKAQDNPSHTSVIYHSQNQNKINALMGIGLFSSPPLIERWQGNSEDHIIYGDVIDGANGLWKTNGNGIILRELDYGDYYIQLRLTDNPGHENITGMWRARIGFDNKENFGYEDERLIFEAMVRPTNYGQDKKNSLFMGLIKEDRLFQAADTLSGVGRFGLHKRFGFAIKDTIDTITDLQIRGIVADGNRVSRTSKVSIRSSSWLYIKAVYDIGTSISFYINGVLVGNPITDNLPYGNDYMQPIFAIQVLSEINHRTTNALSVGKVKCYFQNGQ